MNRLKLILLFAFGGLGAGALYLIPEGSALKRKETWQGLSMPGELSAAHAGLRQNCAACHTPIKGVEAANCSVCHANNVSLLQRQPTAFHASIGSCRECHVEHRGANLRPSGMDHVALAEIGLREVKAAPEGDTEAALLFRRVSAWLDEMNAVERLSDGGSQLAPKEAVLDCAACHLSKDRHVGFFGRDCAQCHATSQWTIPVFRHPSPASRDCVQCHQAPPSHSMMHFQMVSMKVAGQPHATVNQCFLCHQTTAWNDIRNVGWYKHH